MPSTTFMPVMPSVSNTMGMNVGMGMNIGMGMNMNKRGGRVVMA